MIKKFKKKAQPKGCENPSFIKNKRGQEEMVGFAFIVIIVAVILVIFLSITLNTNKDEGPQSFEVESFLQVMLSQTTDCHIVTEYLSIKELISSCAESKTCQDGRLSCIALNDYLEEISESAWSVGSSTSGYKLTVDLNGQPIIPEIFSGNITRNYRGASQNFSRYNHANEYRITFKTYS